MGSRILDDLNSMEMGYQLEIDASAAVRSNHHDDGTISYLIALIEEALAMADASGLATVGIDLCSALERLKAIGDEIPVARSSQHD
jgi:hypothetical protein